MESSITPPVNKWMQREIYRLLFGDNYLFLYETLKIRIIPPENEIYPNYS